MQENWNKIGFVNGSGNSVSTKEYSFIDSPVKSGTYQYRLKQLDLDGNFEYSQSVEVNFSNTPVGFQLNQNFPNPFNPSTTIKFTTPEAGNVSLKVYNLLGQQVRNLVSGFMEAGTHSINFNAVGLQSGLYFYRLESAGLNQVKKMTLLK